MRINGISTCLLLLMVDVAQGQQPQQSQDDDPDNEDAKILGQVGVLDLKHCLHVLLDREMRRQRRRQTSDAIASQIAGATGAITKDNGGHDRE